MTETYEYVLQKKHRAFRKEVTEDFAAEFSAGKLPLAERIVRRFERLAAAEEPHILPGEQIVFLRTTGKAGDVMTKEEWEEYRANNGEIHELGYTSNLCGNYAALIREGLDAVRERADEYARREIAAILSLTDRYRAEAQRMGRNDVAAVLSVVPRKPATTFREALQFFRILHFSLWLEGCYHNTVGRFDQYMYPYFAHDLAAGVETPESAEELLADFFLSFNKDSDLYPGQQQGDNGQSMVLGGCDAEGNDCFNALSEMCLRVSKRLLMIDPKINLRVCSKTPIEVYRLGSELTAAGLGFPQYNNDDVIIPALEAYGYRHEDACNYVVAACWEFIIPGVGYEIVNIGAYNLPQAVREATFSYLPGAPDFETFLAGVDSTVRAGAVEKTAKKCAAAFLPSPLYDLLIPERRYRNFGFHVTGIAGAADALAAIRCHVFEKKDVDVPRLLSGLETDFEKDPQLLRLLRYESPKTGCDDDAVDSLATRLLDDFADGLEGKRNDYGGCYRAGTGTAMYYLWHANKIGATADGRRKGEPFGTNFSPNLFTKTPGPVSVIRSFTKQHLGRVCNGGPLTLEFASSMFADPESTAKLAELVRFFILRGGHQLQLNAVNAEKLKDAQKHPENYGQLVVRIWGWSAYFVELDREYQDHVIARQEYMV